MSLNVDGDGVLLTDAESAFSFNMGRECQKFLLAFGTDDIWKQKPSAGDFK